ncbi:MAG: glycosyltransferase family 10 [Sulfurovaceae bacterium]
MNYKVKLISRASQDNENSRYRKQLPSKNPKLGSCIFTFNALEKEYDWLVVIDDISRIIPRRTEVLSCPKENTILITTEPSSITRYGNAFASQFEYLITNQDEKHLAHPNAMRSQTGNLWFYGREYDTIIKTKPPKKTKKISTVCSNKQQGHTIPDALDDYEFHVAIENHYAKDVWTEKLADAFLGYCVPIYYGCPNVYDYFPKDSIILIDLNDFEGSIKKIQKVIEAPGEYERRLDAVIEARRRVIEEYNLLAMINKIIEEDEQKNLPKTLKGEKIYSRRIMRAKSPIDFLKFCGWKIGNFYKEIFKTT